MPESGLYAPVGNARCVSSVPSLVAFECVMRPEVQEFMRIYETLAGVHGDGARADRERLLGLAVHSVRRHDRGDHSP